MSDDLFIPINRTKMILMTVIYAVLGLVSFSIIYYGGMRFPAVSHTVFKIVALIILLFFAVLAGTFAKNVKNKDAGLHISSKGINDESSSISVGLLPWKDIVEISQYKSASAKYILIQVKQHKKYLDAAKNKAILRLLNQNVALYKTPIVINVGTLKTNLDELERQLNTYLKK
ncbi:hypothetical protein N8987_06005 [Crocinitomix sp.]|nr:hypothetical protein [Crocinitomix sp.]